MGILSRKMAMQGPKEALLIAGPNERRSFSKESQMSYKPKNQRKQLPVKYFNALKPILGSKYESYTKTVQQKEQISANLAQAAYNSGPQIASVSNLNQNIPTLFSPTSQIKPSEQNSLIQSP